jgi:hypothetical protein
MALDEGYRWNVPIVTYGFDQSFLDYFGSNGVAAVESAIRTINDLPAASNIVLTNYSVHALMMNYLAAAEGLLDLKSFTMSLLIEHMGLAQPSRYVFALRSWSPSFLLLADEPSWPPGTVGNSILERNYDPDTLIPSHFVNGNLFTGVVLTELKAGTTVPTNALAEVVPELVDPDVTYLEAVSEGIGLDFNNPGEFFPAFTRDDVGGLRWLLRAANTNYEMLLPDVHGVDTNSTGFVNGAWRPGVEKITFMPHPFLATSNQYLPFMYDFTGTYLTNGILRRQFLERVVAQPDFLFSAGDADDAWPPLFVRSGTEGWDDNAALNWGDTIKAGPGVIRPPVTINFHKVGPMVSTVEGGTSGSGVVTAHAWGSFDGSTNLPIAFPAADSRLSGELAAHLHIYLAVGPNPRPLGSYAWHLPVAQGGQAVLQHSTNLVDWVALGTVTNAGSVIDWVHYAGANPAGFLRVVPR